MTFDGNRFETPVPIFKLPAQETRHTTLDLRLNQESNRDAETVSNNDTISLAFFDLPFGVPRMIAR